MNANESLGNCHRRQQLQGLETEIEEMDKWDGES